MLLYLYCTMCTCVVLSKITSICCANTMQLFFIFYVVMQQILHILCYQYATILYFHVVMQHIFNVNALLLCNYSMFYCVMQHILNEFVLLLCNYYYLYFVSLQHILNLLCYYYATILYIL